MNFVVAHDGFTLADLYRFNTKNNNQPYPNGPSDGGNDNNIGWDQGGVAQEQRKAARNGLALLLLSAGTPMMTAGDEFLRSLNGNNNAYNVDTAFNWLNYKLGPDQKTFQTFARRLLNFRAAHAGVASRTISILARSFAGSAPMVGRPTQTTSTIPTIMRLRGCWMERHFRMRPRLSISPTTPSRQT